MLASIRWYENDGYAPPYIQHADGDQLTCPGRIGGVLLTKSGRGTPALRARCALKSSSVSVAIAKAAAAFSFGKWSRSVVHFENRPGSGIYGDSNIVAGRILALDLEI